MRRREFRREFPPPGTKVREVCDCEAQGRSETDECVHDDPCYRRQYEDTPDSPYCAACFARRVLGGLQA